jgi:hypothetical protein
MSGTHGGREPHGCVRFQRAIGVWFRSNVDGTSPGSGFDELDLDRQRSAVALLELVGRLESGAIEDFDARQSGLAQYPPMIQAGAIRKSAASTASSAIPGAFCFSVASISTLSVRRITRTPAKARIAPAVLAGAPLACYRELHRRFLGRGSS